MYFRNRRMRKALATFNLQDAMHDNTQIQIDNLRTVFQHDSESQAKLDVAQKHLDDARKCNAAGVAAIVYWTQRPISK